MTHREFVEKAMSRFGVSLDKKRSVYLAHVHALESSLKEKLGQRGLEGSIKLVIAEPAPSGTSLLTRTHPLTACLAESLVEASLDQELMPDLGIGRVGAWPSTAVSVMTRVVLLRIRYKLKVHSRKEQLLLAEEAALVALQGDKVFAINDAAREILNTEATADLASIASDRLVDTAKQELPKLLAGPIATFVNERTEELVGDHARLRAAAGAASRVSVEAVLPPDVIGMFVIMPGGF